MHEYGFVMALLELKEGSMTAVATTTFAAEKVLERQHLQAALRDNIAVIDPDLLVIAEEFGSFEGANRRIDLLCLDRTGRLVVVELKRTNDGGHMELQALRYAAMVSTMTFDDVETVYATHLDALGLDPSEAEANLAAWLVDVDDDEIPSRDVRIVLVAADFSREITTTVLWLNDLYGLDVTCVRLSPYRNGDQVLVDVTQVIPLPEAEELTVKLRRKSAVRPASSGRDYTRFRITTPAGTSDPLRKRRAMLHLVTNLAEHGVAATDLAKVLPNAKFLDVDGEYDDEAALAAAFIERWPNANADNLHRWFVDAPIIHDGRTWLLSSQWGRSTEPLLEELCQLHDGFAVAAVR